MRRVSHFKSSQTLSQLTWAKKAWKSCDSEQQGNSNIYLLQFNEHTVMMSASARTSPWLACTVFNSRTNAVNCDSETGFADIDLMTCCSFASVALSRSWQATSSTMHSTPSARCSVLRSCSCNAVVSIQTIFTRAPVDIASTSCCHSLQIRQYQCADFDRRHYSTNTLSSNIAPSYVPPPCVIHGSVRNNSS